jgi:solute carrier family 25 carnitine/acylcarnitine transporter 20/29
MASDETIPAVPASASASAPAPALKKDNKNYKGFVAGVFSGIAKLSGTNLSSYLPHTSLY